MKQTTYFYDSLRRLVISPTARIIVTLIGGSLMNLLYIATNAASAFLYHSIWSATLTVYHLVLIIIRIYLLLAGRNLTDRGGEKRICLRVGILLLLFDVASALIIIYSVRNASFVSYSGYIFMGFLAFTVYSVARSVRDLRKHSDGENHLYYTARNITLATSLMSVFNLQYSFFSFLGADSILMIRAILFCGVSVFSIILVLSVRLMKRGSRADFR